MTAEAESKPERITPTSTGNKMKKGSHFVREANQKNKTKLNMHNFNRERIKISPFLLPEMQLKSL